MCKIFKAANAIFHKMIDLLRRPIVVFALYPNFYFIKFILYNSPTFDILIKIFDYI